MTPTRRVAPRATGRGERGAVTAELALVLPLLVAVTVGLVWLLAVGAAQVRTVDAARETARAVARGDDQASAVARGKQVAPPGSTVTVARTGGEVRVTVSDEVSGPGGLFSHLPAPTVRAEAVAADEESAP
jgi:Flp pilus assembly protein TadG